MASDWRLTHPSIKVGPRKKETQELPTWPTTCYSRIPTQFYQSQSRAEMKAHNPSEADGKTSYIIAVGV